MFRTQAHRFSCFPFLPITTPALTGMSVIIPVPIQAQAIPSFWRGVLSPARLAPSPAKPWPCPFPLGRVQASAAVNSRWDVAKQSSNASMIAPLLASE